MKASWKEVIEILTSGECHVILAPNDIVGPEAQTYRRAGLRVYGQLIIGPKLKLMREAEYVLEHQDKFSTDDVVCLPGLSERIQQREAKPWADR